MSKMGENVPQIIDKAVDFMASSQAFMEYLQKRPYSDRVPADIPEDKAEMFRVRLAHYRAVLDHGDYGRLARYQGDLARSHGGWRFVCYRPVPEL